MLLTLVSPQETIFEWEVEKVTIPTEIGIITVLPHHAPLWSIVKPGILSFVPKKKKDKPFEKNRFFVSGWSNTFINMMMNCICWLNWFSSISFWYYLHPESDEETLEAMKKNWKKY